MNLYQIFALFNLVLTLPVYLTYFLKYLTMGDTLKYRFISYYTVQEGHFAVGFR